MFQLRLVKEELGRRIDKLTDMERALEDLEAITIDVDRLKSQMEIGNSFKAVLDDTKTLLQELGWTTKAVRNCSILLQLLSVSLDIILFRILNISFSAVQKIVAR